LRYGTRDIIFIGGIFFSDAGKGGTDINVDPLLQNVQLLRQQGRMYVLSPAIGPPVRRRIISSIDSPVTLRLVGQQRPLQPDPSLPQPPSPCSVQLSADNANGEGCSFWDNGQEPDQWYCPAIYVIYFVILEYICLFILFCFYFHVRYIFWFFAQKQ
jgi:hypothetical protein